MADNIDNIENGGAENTTPETTVETVEVNDFFATPEVFVEDYFPVDMLNAQDPDKFPYNAEDLVGLPDTTTKKGTAVEEEEGGETITYTITVNQPAEGGEIAASAESAAKGAEITLTATPSESYEFASWSVKDADNNDITVTNDKFTMPESNVTVTATFTEVVSETYTITVNQPAEGGTISASAETAAKDTEITLTATPAENFTFTSWDVKDASDNAITVSENKFTMPESNVTVTATFTSTL